MKKFIALCSVFALGIAPLSAFAFSISPLDEAAVPANFSVSILFDPGDITTEHWRFNVDSLVDEYGFQSDCYPSSTLSYNTDLEITEDQFPVEWVLWGDDAGDCEATSNFYNGTWSLASSTPTSTTASGVGLVAVGIMTGVGAGGLWMLKRKK